MGEGKTRFRLDFIIACHQRSGSHFLQTCLGSHTNISCFGEVVGAIASGREFIEETPRSNVRGAIVMYNQWERVIDQVHFDKIIHLVRDPKKTAYSVVRNRRDKEVRREAHRAHYRVGDPLPPLYDASSEEVMAWEGQIQSSRTWFEDIHRGWPTLTVAYEALTSDRSTEILPREETRRILDFLGVEYQDLSTRLIKGGPTEPNSES